MDEPAIHDPLFREAIRALDNGKFDALENLLEANPQLVTERMDEPKEGYFSRPYLLWFVADNPIRRGKLATNIVDITRLIISYVKHYAPHTMSDQLDYALALVATGKIPRESGVQIELIDVLIASGARPGDPNGALAHHNLDAAQHIIDVTGKWNLTAAVSLEKNEKFDQLLSEARQDEKQVALIAAAFFGKKDMLERLLDAGADVNAYISEGFHSHATALHQAVYSGSLEAVKILVDAGANLDAKDRVYDGTPLGWAQYMQTEETDKQKLADYARIESYLKEVREPR